MTVAQLERRLEKVEKTIEELTRRGAAEKSPRWYATHAGRFANDPVFDEIVRLGKDYRDSQRPAKKGGRRANTR